MADGTTDNAYSQALQQILGQSKTPGVFGYGFSNSDIQRLQSAGITPQQLMQMGLSTQPQTTTSAYQSGGQGTTTSPSAGGIQQSNNAAMLQAMLQLGGGQQQQAPTAPGNAYGQAYPLYAQDAQGNPTGKPVYANPKMQANLLGAAALGMNPVINQEPSGTPSSVSGVAPTGGALIGTNVPQTGWNWDTLAHAAGLSSPDIAAYAKAGYTPDTLGKKLGLGSGADPGMAGPWLEQPGIFTKAQTVAPTVALGAKPLTAAAQPTATAYNPTATPFAQPPPAPGLTLGAGTMPPASPLFAAHTSALADAGKALFAHFGGDPNSASSEDIANFHSQLTSAVGQHAAGGNPMANPLASGPPQPIPWQQAWAGQHGLTNPTPPAGGPSPSPWQGGPNPQTGVMPNFNPATLAAAPQPTAAKKMASGGFVQGFDDGGSVADPNAPPEARRKTLSTPASGAPPSQTSSAPTVPTGTGLATGLTSAVHTYANSIHNFAGAGTRDIRNTPLDPDPDLPYLKAAGMAGGGAGSGQPTANALSGIGSGLTQAAQAIASSVHPWQMQQSAIPTPPPAPAAPQLTPPPAPQQTQQGVNPYAAYAANQAMYPTSPYYR